MKEDKARFFQWLRSRGMDGVKLIVGDKCLGMLEAVGEVSSKAKYQRRPLLPQCVLGDAPLQGKAGGQDAQGNPYPRE